MRECTADGSQQLKPLLFVSTRFTAPWDRAFSILCNPPLARGNTSNTLSCEVPRIWVELVNGLRADERPQDHNAVRITSGMILSTLVSKGG